MTDQRRSSEDLLVGRTIAGKYTVESRVGGGGMGSVYRARQAGLDKTIAIKVLHRELLAEATFASRFKREATSASRIDHPHSLRVIDFGEEPDGLLYIAMEFLEGKSLFRVLRDEAPLAPARIVDLSRQILAALAAAHELGIVHRDLKPENVIVLSKKDDEGNASEFVKVCDFGIAKLATKGEVDEKLTLEGSIVGTPEYLSPEQARGGELDARSDLYSMGVILFEALTGEPPYRGDTPLSIVLKHLDAPIPKPSALAPSVDPKLEAVCLKALSKSPGDRFASAREMRAALATDTPDAAAAPRSMSRSSLLVMTETPPPVSSTQAPLHLTSKRSAPAVSVARPRLSELTETPSSFGARTTAAVVALALLGGGGGAYWLRKHPGPRGEGARGYGAHAVEAAAARAPVEAVVPATAPVPTTPASAEPAPSLAPLSSAVAAAFPPSELTGGATPAASASSAHGHGAQAPAKGAAVAAVAASSVVASDALPEAPPSAPPSTTRVRFANIQVTNIAATNVTAALPVARFARCYHGASGAHATASLHLDLSATGTVARCAISDSAMAEVGACLVDAAKRVVVSAIPAGGASADVDVAFDVP